MNLLHPLPVPPATRPHPRLHRAAAAAFERACTARATLDTPLGRLLLARTSSGLAGAWFDGQKDHPGALAVPERPGDELLARTAQRLAAYFRAEPIGFDDLAVDFIGTPFQRAVWQALRAIGRGRTASYGEVAARIGAPTAVRAVGAAIGRNPLSVIVPCHRVVGAGGALTGYAGGLHRKAALLGLEGVVA